MELQTAQQPEVTDNDSHTKFRAALMSGQSVNQDELNHRIGQLPTGIDQKADPFEQ